MKVQHPGAMALSTSTLQPDTSLARLAARNQIVGRGTYIQIEPDVSRSVNESVADPRRYTSLDPDDPGDPSGDRWMHEARQAADMLLTNLKRSGDLK